MPKSTIQQLAEHGQSIWLDYISRPLLDTGKLKALIDQGLRGMTSNPSIFNQAIGSSNDYDRKIVELKTKGKTTFEIYDALTIKDIQDAADQFKGVFEATKGLDGYVSLEINPLLADKIEEQAQEGIRLFDAVKRKNVMIKVPSTDQGFPVIEELISRGINVNVTLIFSLAQYEKTVAAYFAGLKRLSKNTNDLSSVRSVASVFISRIDSTIDKTLDDFIKNEKDATRQSQLRALKGKAAVANSRIIFERFKKLFNGQEFQALKSKGANIQRVLWGSTSTKNPDYSDVKYVTELIASPTVNTLPEKTLMAFLDHGQVKEAFDYDVKQAEDVVARLKKHNIDVNQVCAQLLIDGVNAFNQAFEELQSTLEKKAEQLSSVN